MVDAMLGSECVALNTLELSRVRVELGNRDPGSKRLVFTHPSGLYSLKDRTN